MLTRPYISEVALQTPVDAHSYLAALPIVRYWQEGGRLTFSHPVTFLVGENGTGKSTLIEAIAIAAGFNPEGGTRNFRFSTNASHSDLWKHLRLSKRDYAEDGFFLRAESFYTVASHIDELDRQPAAAPPVIDSYGGVSLHEQSHGESFLALVQHRLGGHGLYILDEPEAALSPMRLLTLLIEMDRLVKADSQLIIATHSPILMAFEGADIWEMSTGGVRRVRYEDTEHYQVSRRFLNDPAGILKQLLDDEST